VLGPHGAGDDHAIKQPLPLAAAVGTLRTMVDPNEPTVAEDALAAFRAQSTPAPIAPTIPGYVIERRIGSGGMGDVWLARHQTLDRVVALKVVRSDLANDPNYVDRFLREARAAAKVNHPRVVTVHDAGQTAGHLFLAMEYVPGGDAHDRLDVGPMTEAEALTFLEAAAEGLQAIHDAGLLHRDIKPENLFIGNDGLPKIGDLGLARSEAGDDRMTQTGHAIGTPAYMSPEQANGVANLDGRSDIYSLAATGFALLTGRPPFVGATPWATVAQVINDPAPDPRQCNAAVSPGVAEALRQALAKDPAQRPLTARDFAQSLRQSVGKPMPKAMPSSATVRPWWRHRVVLGIAGVLLGVVGTGILVAVLSDSSSARSKANFIPVEPATARSGTETPKSGSAPAAHAAPKGESVSRTKEDRGIGGVFGDIKAGVRGTLRDAMNGTVVDVQRDAERALKRNGITITKSRIDEGRGILEGSFANGDELRVTTTRLTSESVEVAVQVGAFGDQTRQRLLLDWIRAAR
jgi:serine/threonine protein kinase